MDAVGQAEVAGSASCGMGKGINSIVEHGFPEVLRSLSGVGRPVAKAFRRRAVGFRESVPV